MKSKVLATIVLSTLCISVFSQNKSNTINDPIKETIISFLNWYKANGKDLIKSPIVSGFNQDTIKKDSVVKINMVAVEKYLANFKKSNFVSATFLNDLRSTFKNVEDTLTKYPIVDYFGPVPGLESDLVFGFEPEEILDHIDEGKFTRIDTVYDKALVKFDITKLNQYIFTMTKINGKWLIDYFGFDRTNFF